MLKRLLKIIIGICLLPVCWAVSRSFYELIFSLGQAEKTAFYFLGGIGLYAVMYFSNLKFNYLYILGHESTHALLALLCGAKIKSFKVSSKGGSVASTKTNVLISLGPYFFPIYTVFAALSFFALSFFVKDMFRYSHILILVIGWSLSFHFLMTLNSLQVEQPDLVENGYLFSLTFIYIISLIVLAIVLGLVFKQTDLTRFFIQTADYTKAAVMFLVERISSFQL
jgi:hypothetical protein